MKRVLIIWNEIPDDCSFIELNVNDEIAELLKTFHNFVINAVVDYHLERQMIQFFYTDDGKLKFEKQSQVIIDKHFDMIIITGFAS